MDSVKKLVRRVVKRVRGNKQTITMRKHDSKESQERFSCGDVQIVRYHQRCNGTMALTPDRQPQQYRQVTKRSSEELDERINTIRARHQRQLARVPPELDSYVYVGSMLHVSITRQVAGNRDMLPPLNTNFAASNISTFIERLTFSHATAGHDHSTPLAAAFCGRQMALVSRTQLPALSFLREDDEFLPQIQLPGDESGCRSSFS